MADHEKQPILIVFGGLPGTGKTTLAKATARELSATYLRIDAIEQALRAPSGLPSEIGTAGYVVAYALAESNLRLGGVVVADSVNSLAVTRNAWRQVATNALSRIVEVEIICSDQVEHKRRVETRTDDIAGLPLTWKEVIERDYEAWDQPHIMIDTANYSVDMALTTLLGQIRSQLDFQGK